MLGYEEFLIFLYNYCKDYQNTEKIVKLYVYVGLTGFFALQILKRRSGLQAE